MWPDGSQLDLHTDLTASADAIRTLAGSREASGYLSFMAECREIYTTLKDSFMGAEKPSPLTLLYRIGSLSALWRTRPFETYWSRVSRHFTDPRLRQLFGRYTTYVGSSPFMTPATLMLIAHVEQDGVWLLPQGMKSLATALRTLAEAGGAEFRFGKEVETISLRAGRVSAVRLKSGEELDADAVVFNGDISALGSGLLGNRRASPIPPVPARQRSLSAVTWCLRTKTSGLPLSYHNVLFGDDYADEFEAVFRRRQISTAPTVYICAQDRLESRIPDSEERLLLLINAPADGDHASATGHDPLSAEERLSNQLERHGLILHGGIKTGVMTGPAGFNSLFPATGGALYGAANHSPMASFSRPGSRTAIPGLYVAGGSAHPGAGVPMATLSGRLAAARLLEDVHRNRN
jgi:1-hydroxycarotenoid 3,4-desaturase